MRFGERRRMIDTLRRLGCVAAVTLAAIGLATPIGAAPTRAHAAPVAAPTRAVSAALRTPLTFHVTPMSFTHHAMSLHTTDVFPALVAPPQTHRVWTLLPRFAAAALTAPFDVGGCDERARTLVTTLPTTPFAPLDCARRASSSSRADGFIAGHNKNALYGPAYTPHVDDQP